MFKLLNSASLAPPLPLGFAVKGGARRAEYLPQAQEVWWRRTDEGGLHIVVKAQFDSYAVLNAGAPQALWTEIRCARVHGGVGGLPLAGDGICCFDFLCVGFAQKVTGLPTCRPARPQTRDAQRREAGPAAGQNARGGASV